MYKFSSLDCQYDFNNYLFTKGSKKVNQSKIIKVLRELNINKKFDGLIHDLESCCKDLYFTSGFLSEKKLSKAFLCKNHTLCDICAENRRTKLVNKFYEKFKEIIKIDRHIKLSEIVTTVINRDNLLERFKHLKRAHGKISALMREAKRGKSKSEWGKVLGYITSVEISRKRDTWHVHAHTLVLHYEDFNENKIISEWFKITKDSLNVYIRSYEHRDFLRAIRYITKPNFNYLDEYKRVEVYEQLKGRRLITSGGLFRGIELAERSKAKQSESAIFGHELYTFNFDTFCYENARQRSQNEWSEDIYDLEECLRF